MDRTSRNASRRAPVQTQGFTLVELLIVVAIAAILATVGTPSFLGTITSYRISTEVNSLVGDLQYARSEAVKQGIPVQVCISTDSKTCSTSSTSWAAGHIVVTSPPGSDCTQVNKGCTLLRVQQAFSGTDQASDTVGLTTSIAFNRDGFAGVPSTASWNGFAPLGQALYVTVHANPDIGMGSCVFINPVGQMSVVLRGATAVGATTACS
jgi:type IV fimbrial biogenesis protein FimT